MGVGRTFSRGANSGFFQRGTKSGKISFFPLGTKKTIFFAKILLEKYQISQCRRVGPACNPLPTPMCLCEKWQGFHERQVLPISN